MRKYYKIIFADLDDTLIRTCSGKTFAEDLTDFRIRKDVIDIIRDLVKNHGLKNLFIVTNQGGIPEYVSYTDFETKLMSIKAFISGYTHMYVHSKYCADTDESNPRRKPNPGMLNEFWNILKDHGYTKADCLMIGDASGKPGDFSDSDKKTAENFGCDYLDVDEFVSLYSSSPGTP